MDDTSLMHSVTGLIPMAHTADVQRSVEFYKLLGMQLRGSLRNDAGGLQWAHVSCKQAVLFYLYATDLVALREHLLTHGVRVSSITYPEYMPKGEVRVDDPDG